MMTPRKPGLVFDLESGPATEDEAAESARRTWGNDPIIGVLCEDAARDVHRIFESRRDGKVPT